MASSSSSFPASRQHMYDVFLSFRGEETRENFISHLQDALYRKGIAAFADSELRRGEEIASAIFQAIEVSKVAVIIFSKDYASSTWCLDEVAKIIECHETRGQIVIPVFYHVKPTYVRKQTGTFAEALIEHERDLKNFNKVQRWRAALTKTANLTGWDSQVTRPESRLVDEIVKDVFERSKQESAGGSEGLMATNSRTQHIESVSIKMSNGHTLRILDMGGTTLVRAGTNCGTRSTDATTNAMSYESGVFSSSTSVSYHMRRTGISRMVACRTEEFTFGELAYATSHFSQIYEVGRGGFGSVYRGTLWDGRQVAIKKAEPGQEYQDKKSAFQSELVFLSILNHKHVIRLVGYCENWDERILVYEYMKNGALGRLLHDQKNMENRSGVINSWKMRIKIALEAAKAIEYIHNHAVPPIIHRDIKSAIILLDADWTARVCDFGLSLIMDTESESANDSTIVGTIGYVDPECLNTCTVTTKSDVYSFGVVLLELLTGKRAVFEDDENGGTSRHISDFAVPRVMADEYVQILDPRASLPEINEAKALQLVAQTAMFCVKSERKDRPTMTEVVATLQWALTLCNKSHGSISSDILSIVSD